LEEVLERAVLKGSSNVWKVGRGGFPVLKREKIVLPVDQMLGKENVLAEALGFEELYLSSKLEAEQWLSRVDRDRLAELKKRI
jgi:hypothetical protein